MQFIIWIFLWIPLVVSAEIVVEIVPGEASSPQALVRGGDRGKTSSTDVEAFHLTPIEVRENLKRLGYRGLGNIVINQASGHGLRDLHVTLKPKRARIVRNNERVLSDEIHYISIRKDHVDIQVNASVAVKWYEKKNISIGNIRHILAFNRLDHTFVYGEDDFASIDIPVTVNVDDNYDNIRVEVKETTVVVRIDYKLSLEGDIYFERFCVPRLEYCLGTKLDVSDYFKKLNYSPILESYAIATFTYCHDAKVTPVKDMEYV